MAWDAFGKSTRHGFGCLFWSGGLLYGCVKLLLAHAPALWVLG